MQLSEGPTPQERASAQQAASQPGVHYRPHGFRERVSHAAGGVKEKVWSVADFRILGRPLYEVVADIAAGFVVKSAIKGVVTAGAVTALGPGTLVAFGAAVAAGAASGAAFAGGREWIRQARENWQQPLSPEAVTKKQKLLERLKDLKPNDWQRLGKTTLRGAIVGAAGGAIGAVIYHVATSAPAPEEVSPTPTDIPAQETTTVFSETAPTYEPMPEITPTPEAEVLPPTAAAATPVSAPTDIATPVSGEQMPDTSKTFVPQETITQQPPETTVTTQPSTDQPSQEPITKGGPTISGETETQVPTAQQPEGTGEPAVPASADAVTEHVQTLGDYTMQSGDNPWKVAEAILKEANPDHVPTSSEIMQVTKAICEQNSIGVPDWGVVGEVDHKNIPVGYILKMDPEVKSVITSVLKGGR